MPEHPGTGFRISLIDPPPLSGELQFVSKQLQLIGFWTSIRLQPVVDMVSDYGTTWLELYAFRTLRGGSISTKQGEGTAGHRPRFNMLYKAFIRQSKFMLQFADLESRQLVRNLANRERPLTAYGVMSFLPMIASRLVLTGEAATLVHHAMLSIHGTFKNRKSVPTKLRAGNFKAPKHTPWDHIALDNWLPDYAARHLSNMTDKEFVVKIPCMPVKSAAIQG